MSSVIVGSSVTSSTRSAGRVAEGSFGGPCGAAAGPAIHTKLATTAAAAQTLRKFCMVAAAYATLRRPGIGHGGQSPRTFLHGGLSPPPKSPGSTGPIYNRQLNLRRVALPLGPRQWQ